MKKNLSIFLIVCFNFIAFGQGQATFEGNFALRMIWDDFSSSQPQLAATMNVAFLYGEGTPVVDGVFTSVPTNSLNAGPFFSYSQAWSDILNDPNFILATNADAMGSPAITTNTALGGWVYNNSSSFTVTNSIGGQTYQVFVIGWSKNYATPQQAALAGAAVGWSTPFSYTFTSNPSPPVTMSSSGLTPFGVGTIQLVPEPASAALAGLGGVSLLMIRRRS
jgi:hypothetical protein